MDTFLIKTVVILTLLYSYNSTDLHWESMQYICLTISLGKRLVYLVMLNTAITITFCLINMTFKYLWHILFSIVINKLAYEYKVSLLY